MEKLTQALLVIPWLLIAAAGASPGQALPGGAGPAYLHDLWQLEEGLPQITVWAIAQDTRGYLWLGTEEGLARFDGVRFEIFDRRTTPELPGNLIQALAADPEGGLWIGTHRGLARLADGRLTAYGSADGLVHETIFALHLNRAGRLWIGTGGGLASFDGERFTSWAAESGLGQETVRALAEDRRGHLWIGTDGGLASFDGERFGTYTTRDGLLDDRVEAILEDGEGRLWIGSDAGLQMSPPPPGGALGKRQLTIPPGVESLVGTPVWELLEDRQGQLWIGTKAGLARLAGGQLVRYPAPAVLPDPHIAALWEDAEDSLWIGTRYGGLVRFRERLIAAFGTPEGLIHDLVWSIYQDRADNVWIATDGGLDRLAPDGSLTHTTTRDGLPSPDVGALYEDRHGNLWVGTFGDGLVRLRDGEVHVYTAADGFPPVAARCFAEDPRGDLWIGTERGLVRFAGGELETFTTRDGLPDDDVRGLHVDGEGTLRIATYGGLSSYHPNGSPPIRRLAGPFPGRPKSLYGEDDGSLWIGTGDDGLVRFRDGTYDTFTEADGLYDQRIHQILDDRRGSLWLSSNRGIFRVDRGELEAFAAGRIPSITSVAYDESDGMRVRECNGSTQSAGARTRDGRLWFPTIRGVAIVDTEALGTPSPAPPVVIEEVLVDHRPIALGGRAEIGPGARELEFRYTALAFVKPHKVRFRYRLEGFDKGWVEAGSRRFVQYTNLRPGSYHFQVLARGGDGVWSEHGDTFELELRPAFHQTWPFYVLCAASLGLAVWGAHRLRVRALVHHTGELYRMKGELKAKNAEVEAKNAELERFTYTVSHDLKSPIFTIEGFLGLLVKDVEAGDRQRVVKDVGWIRGAVAKMRRLLEELLELSRIGRVVNPSEEVDLRVLAREAVAQVGGRIDELGVQVVVGPDLPTVVGDRTRLLEVFQNLIENAVKYMGEQRQPKIEIGAVRKGGETCCYVRDNGLGIDPRFLEKVFGLFEQLDPQIDGTGIGLALVQRIVEFHGGRIWAESEGPGQGSSFVFTLPDSA